MKRFFNNKLREKVRHRGKRHYVFSVRRLEKRFCEPFFTTVKTV
jgi:hypothetical protein